MRDKGYEMQVPFALGASGQLKDLGFDDAIGIVLNAVLAEGEMIQYRFEQSIAVAAREHKTLGPKTSLFSGPD
jgi:hypothetical protein